MIKDFKGKIAVITGATDGIGKQTAIDLANKGLSVIIHGRNEEKSLKVLEEVEEKSGNCQLDSVYGDLSSFKQIQGISDQLHQKIDHLDVLINNAGVGGYKKEYSEEGYDLTFTVNHLAPFMLTILLLDLLKKDTPSRIVNLSSWAQSLSIDFDHIHDYPYWKDKKPTTDANEIRNSAYGLSKTCITMFTFDLADKLKETGITVNCLHPGGFNTKMVKPVAKYMGWDLSTVSPLSRGSQNVIHLATSPNLEGVTGKFFHETTPARSADVTYDPAVRKKLWDLSEKLTGIRFNDFTKILMT